MFFISPQYIFLQVVAPLYFVIKWRILAEHCLSGMCACLYDHMICNGSEVVKFGKKSPIWPERDLPPTSLFITNQINLEVIVSDSFKNLEELSILKIHQTPNMQRFDKGWMNGINDSLDEFSFLSAPKVTDLPVRMFTSTTNLSFIQISGTSMTLVRFLHGTRGDQLTRLVLMNNLINAFVPGTFLGFPNLVEVDLRWNRLIALDNCAFEHILDKMELLLLAGNRWLCTCPIRWLTIKSKSLASHRDHVTHFQLELNGSSESPHCSQPVRFLNISLKEVDIVDCVDAVNSDCSKYQKEAAAYLTTTRSSLPTSGSSVNLIVIYIIVAGGLVFIISTITICIITYLSKSNQSPESGGLKQPASNSSTLAAEKNLTPNFPRSGQSPLSAEHAVDPSVDPVKTNHLKPHARRKVQPSVNTKTKGSTKPTATLQTVLDPSKQTLTSSRKQKMMKPSSKMLKKHARNANRIDDDPSNQQMMKSSRKAQTAKKGKTKDLPTTRTKKKNAAGVSNSVAQITKIIPKKTAL